MPHGFSESMDAILYTVSLVDTVKCLVLSLFTCSVFGAKSDKMHFATYQTMKSRLAMTQG